MANGSDSPTPSLEHVAEMRAAISRAVTAAAQARAHLARQREFIIDQRDAILEPNRVITAALQSRMAESQALCVELRQTVDACIRQLKSQATPPEQVLALIKALTRSAAQPELEPREVQELVTDVVEWSIDAYYSTT